MKTLVLRFEIGVEYRASVHDFNDRTAVARAIEEAISKSHLTQQSGVIAESIRFTVEDSD